MKNRFLPLLLITLVLMVMPFTSQAQIKKAYLGRWNFEAPGAPDGYTYGTIEMKSDSIKTSFSSSDFKFPSVWVKAKNDSITYIAIIDGVDVVFSLKIENDTSIRGNAVWSDGEAIMILKRKKE